MFKVLIVEDDKNIREYTRDYLSKYNFQVFMVEDFSNILKDFSNIMPHIILLDINLPVYDGFYWCEKIRELSNVPIIFITSRDTDMDLIMSVSVGGDDFINKPFTLQVLKAKIDALLRRTYTYHNTDTNILEKNGLVLNIKNNTAIYKDDTLELSKNEFKILHLLLKNSGSIITRDEIMNELWDNYSFIDDNTLTVNVTRLKKNLEKINLYNLIKTKKGQGYFIE